MADTTVVINSSDITSLNVRDQFAMRALESLIKIHDGNITKDVSLIVKKAYVYAEEMLNKSAEIRTKNGDTEEEETSPETSPGGGGNIEGKLQTIAEKLDSVKTALQGTLKVDNPPGDLFDVSGGGGGGGHDMNFDSINSIPKESIPNYVVCYDTKNRGKDVMKYDTSVLIDKIINSSVYHERFLKETHDFYAHWNIDGVPLPDPGGQWFEFTVINLSKTGVSQYMSEQADSRNSLASNFRNAVKRILDYYHVPTS